MTNGAHLSAKQHVVSARCDAAAPIKNHYDNMRNGLFSTSAMAPADILGFAMQVSEGCLHLIIECSGLRPSRGKAPQLLTLLQQLLPLQLWPTAHR